MLDSSYYVIGDHSPLSLVRFTPLSKGVRHDANEGRDAFLTEIHLVDPLITLLELLGIPIVLDNHLVSSA